MFDFYRIAVATPKIKLGDPLYNVDVITRIATEAERNGAQIILFPELALTGASCGDVFMQPLFQEAVNAAKLEIQEWTTQHNILLIYGACDYNSNTNQLLNTCEIVDRHLAISRPKFYIPRDSAQGRIFDTPYEFEMPSLGQFEGENEPLKFGVIFDDELLDNASHIVSELAHGGANVIFNLNAAPYIAGTQTKAWTRGEVLSAEHRIAYAMAVPGAGESSSDNVFAGNSFICEDGTLLAVGELFAPEGSLIYADIDVGALNIQRMHDSAFEQFPLPTHTFAPPAKLQTICRNIDPLPFVPDDDFEAGELSEDILDMQATALIQRLNHMGTDYAIIGLSGGLDSTLALLATHRAFIKSGRKTQNIITVTMPGFGTGKRTYENACKLAKCLKITLKEIDITQACTQHFKDIEHDPKLANVVFENAQARERTQILLSIANRHHALMIGTGDLSEIALGWSTFNGDHMSMYAINAGIPKTLIRRIVQHVADITETKGLNAVLSDILETPISPELLPAKNARGKIVQSTEEILGPYEIHDFFLWNLIAQGFTPPKVLKLAEMAFEGKYTPADLKEKLRLFIRRFFNAQFKRNCAPDGPMILPIALGQRADWRMPSDLSAQIWLDSISD